MATDMLRFVRRLPAKLIGHVVAATAWLRIKGYQTTSTDKHPHERHKAVLNKYLSAIPTPSGRAEKVREMLRRLASGGASRTTQSKLREVPVKHTRKVFLFSNFAWSVRAHVCA